MKNAGQVADNEGHKNVGRKLIKLEPKAFKSLPHDEELYNLDEVFNPKFDKSRLLRESTLEYNGFSQDVMENFPDKAEEILTIARRGVYDDKNTVLQEMMSTLGADGVGYIKGANHWQEDWQNKVGAFVDMGDDNTKTIFYDTITEEFSVTNVNDFILLKDQEYRIIGSEGL